MHLIMAVAHLVEPVWAAANVQRSRQYFAWQQLSINCDNICKISVHLSLYKRQQCMKLLEFVWYQASIKQSRK